jgi:hypothetical protein
MRRVLPTKFHKSTGHAPQFLRLRYRDPDRGKQPELVLRCWESEKLHADRASEHLGKQRRYGVANLFLNETSAADNSYVVWKGL